MMTFSRLMNVAVTAFLLTTVNGFPPFIAPPEVSSQCPNPPGQYPLLLPNPTDCGSFYMCSWDHMAFLQYCPSVLHFNPALQVCDSPAHFTCNIGNNNTQNPPVTGWKPVTSEPDSSEEDKVPEGGHPEVVTAPPEVAANCPPFSHDRVGMISDPTNCANFYMCLESGTAVLKHCPAGLLFNLPIQVCDYPENVKCGATSAPDSSKEDKEPEGGHPEVVTAPPEVAANCPPFSHDRVGMISDPTNCANFYMCLESGTAVLKHCPAGLFFNLPIQVCDYPENVKCGATSAPDSSKEDNEPEGGHPEVITAPPEVAANCPPFSHDRVGMISDPTNCANFYMCLESGTAVLKHCPAGLFFNLPIQVCDYPENVQCGATSA